MWNKFKQQGGDVILVSVLLFSTCVLGISVTKSKWQETAIGLAIIATHLLYVRKAWELEASEKEFKGYKASVYTTEILTSDVEKYMANVIDDLKHLEEQHSLNKGMGLFKHLVETYRVNDEELHTYISPLGANELVRFK